MTNVAHDKLHYSGLGYHRDGLVRCGLWLTIEQSKLYVTDDRMAVTCGYCTDIMRADGDLHSCKTCGWISTNPLDVEAHELGHT